MGSSRDLMDELEEAMKDANAVVDEVDCRGTPYTNPKGWTWDAASHAWIHDDGTRMSHFTPTGQAAVVSGGKLMAPITPRPSYPHASIGATGAIGAPYHPINPLGGPTGGHFTIDKYINIDKSPVCGEMAVMTPHGKVKINLDTGVLTIPHGIGREEAIRDFWLGFQENFRGAEKTKYEDEIHSLKKDIEHITQRADEYRKHADDVVKESIVKKISEKYGNEKFIMMKPVDLIKFIEQT